jgi:O-succinylbenzoic acid--CoA ligase
MTDMTNANFYALVQQRFPTDRGSACIETAEGLVYSWKDLHRGSGRIANWLAALGMAPGARVAVQVEKSPECLMLYLATLRAGLVYLPLNTAYQKAEIEYFLADAQPELVVCTPARRGEIEPLAQRAKCRHVHTLGEARDGSLLQMAAPHADDFDTRLCQPTDLAAILYTSGTTGTPRGAVLTRAAFVASAAASAANLGWQPDDCWLLCMPIAHVGGLSILTRCLAARRCVALAPRFDAALLPQWIDGARVTLVSLVPTMLERVLDAHPGWRGSPGLRAILLGGAVATPRLVARTTERGLPVLTSYGLTETCAQVTATRYATRFSPLDRGAGQPLPGVDVRVVDGRIEVRGPTLMAGYLGEPPLVPGAWFDTGDLGEIDAHGCLHVHARRTDLIVTGGENVYPAEVERVLEDFPGVASAGVFGVPDATWGQTVAAALVAERDPPSDAVLVAFLAARLAPHKRPRHVCYVPRLPQTTAGKLDRAALAAFAAVLRPLSATAAG